MALDGALATQHSDRPGTLQAALSTAIAGVNEVCGRLGLGEFMSQDEAPPMREVANREEWALISGEVLDAAQGAAFATGLHHRAAAELDGISRELTSIAALLGASSGR